jgi:hypothetical protein
MARDEIANKELIPATKHGTQAKEHLCRSLGGREEPGQPSAQCLVLCCGAGAAYANANSVISLVDGLAAGKRTQTNLDGQNGFDTGLFDGLAGFNV